MAASRRASAIRSISVLILEKCTPGLSVLRLEDKMGTRATKVAATLFRICAWRTNDARNDLTHQEFLELCGRALRHAGCSVDFPRDKKTLAEGGTDTL